MGYFASDQKTSFTKKFSIDPLNLNPGGCLQNPKFAFYHLRLLQCCFYSDIAHVTFASVDSLSQLKTPPRVFGPSFLIV